MNRVLKLQKLNAEFETKNAKVIFTAGCHSDKLVNRNK